VKPVSPAGAVMTAFGEQMSRLMAEQGMSLHRLARVVHYDVGYLCKVKNGRKRPSAALAARVDEALARGRGACLPGARRAAAPPRPR
jgi:transcriptional regulator with XRE-family HTH domain